MNSIIVKSIYSFLTFYSSMIFIANSTNLKKQPNQKDTTFRQDTLSIAGQSVTENSVVTQSTDIASTALSTERILPTSNTTGKVSWQFAFYIDFTIN